MLPNNSKHEQRELTMDSLHLTKQLPFTSLQISFHTIVANVMEILKMAVFSSLK